MSEERPGDARDRLAGLEEKLRALESELLGGIERVEDAASEPEPQREPAPEPAPEPRWVDPEPEPVEPVEPDRLPAAEVNERLALLRATLEGLTATSGELRAVARAVVDDHARMAVRLERVASAVRADALVEPEPPPRHEEQAPPPAPPRFSGTVVVEAGPFDAPEALHAFRRRLAETPGARDVYLRSLEEGHAVIEVELDEP